MLFFFCTCCIASGSVVESRLLARISVFFSVALGIFIFFKTRPDVDDEFTFLVSFSLAPLRVFGRRDNTGLIAFFSTIGLFTFSPPRTRRAFLGVASSSSSIKSHTSLLCRAEPTRSKSSSSTSFRSRHSIFLLRANRFLRRSASSFLADFAGFILISQSTFCRRLEERSCAVVLIKRALGFSLNVRTSDRGSSCTRGRGGRPRCSSSSLPCDTKDLTSSNSACSRTR